MDVPKIPHADTARSAVRALGGYVYQIYQSALGWVNLKKGGRLYLEVAEDFAIAAGHALEAVQVKNTTSNITLISKDVLASIDSFVRLYDANKSCKVNLRFLTTSNIGKEQSPEHRIGDKPALETWRNLATTGDITDLKNILLNIKLSDRTKEFIQTLSDTDFRSELLQRIHFDCGSPSFDQLELVLKEELYSRLRNCSGVLSQLDACLNEVIVVLLNKAASEHDRCVDWLALEKIIEKATHITLPKAQFETGKIQVIPTAPREIVDSTILDSFQAGLHTLPPQEAKVLRAILDSFQAGLPTPIDDVPLPQAIATRQSVMGAVRASIEDCGFVWIYGPAGSGKTFVARFIAKYLKSNWGIVNLRGYETNQVKQTLSSIGKHLHNTDFGGIVLDDFDHIFDPSVFTSLCYLQTVMKHRDIAFVVTASNPLGPTACADMGLPSIVNQKVSNFSVEDIREILKQIDVEIVPEAEQIYSDSEEGHPQLVIATIQSITSRERYPSTETTAPALSLGSKGRDAVRRAARIRLSEELPDTERRLLERLSLTKGSFSQDFVLSAVNIEPKIPQGSVVFDRLVGAWIEQQSSDTFALSPLLSDFGATSICEEEKQKIHYSFADILLKIRTLEPLQANSALFSAWNGKNTDAIHLLCYALLYEGGKSLDTIAPFLTISPLLDEAKRTGPSDPNIRLLLRGTQLVLAIHKDTNDSEFCRILQDFENESRDIEGLDNPDLMRYTIYTMLLLSFPKFGAIPRFWELLQEVERFVKKNADTIPPEILSAYRGENSFNLPWIPFMFTTQANRLHKIADLPPLFNYLASRPEEHRNHLLSALSKPGFGADMLVSGAWASEEKADSINASIHAEIFHELEMISCNWSPQGIAVSCRKYHAFTLDQNDGEKEAALAVLAEGLDEYGTTNSMLMLAQANVLYRAGEYAESLELVRQIIEGDTALPELEKVFLGRDAAAIAEQQGDFEAARTFYLLGHAAASKCEDEDMQPVCIGLLADAALVSWHADNRAACLKEFKTVLRELESLDANASLRSTYCHSTIEHALVWMQDTALGELLQPVRRPKANIYPGMMSNPEPHPSTAERPKMNGTLAWYTLASIENYADLDIGVTEQLDALLPDGPALEGQQLLYTSQMHRAIATLKIDLFFEALQHHMSLFTYLQNSKHQPDTKNLTFIQIPLRPRHN